MPANKTDYTDKEPDWTDWDGSPLTKQKWYDELPDRFRKYRTLWERGVMVHKGVTNTSSPEHSYHIVMHNIKEGTFKEPYGLNMLVKKDASVADGAVPDNKKSRFADAPEQLVDDDRDLFDCIANSISCHQTRKDYKESTAASGIKFLKLLASEHEESNEDLASWAAARRLELVTKGIEAPTVIAFNRFREDYNEYTSQMGDRGGSDLVTSKALLDAARDLGDTIQMKVDLKVEMKKPADLAATVELIKRVITKYETSNTGKGRGHSRQLKPSGGGDAEKSRFHDSSGKRVFVNGSDEDCTICKGRFGNGKHLRIDCPDWDSSKSASRREASKDAKDAKPKRKGQARVASGDDDALSDADSSYYDGNDGVDLASTSDLALSELFAGGTRAVDVKRGSAKAARTGRPVTPVPPQPDGLESSSSDSDDEATTPAPSLATRRPSLVSPALAPISFVPHSEARRRVEALSPQSPMKEIAAVKTDTGIDVSLACGGANTAGPGVSRSRYHIVTEMRQSVGLPPLSVPTGYAVDGGHAQPSAATVAPAAPATHAPSGAAAALGTPLVAPPPEPHAPIFAAAAAIPHLPSNLVPALEFVSLQRQSDGAGGLVHAYTLRDGFTDLRATCPAAGPREVACAPAGAVLLGTCEATTYWVITETSALVMTVAAPKASSVEPPKATDGAAALGAPAPPSFLLHAAVALLAVVATLLMVVIVTAAPVVSGHASLPSPFPEPGTCGPLLLHAGRALSLHALSTLLAHSILAGYTVAAAGAHAAAWLAAACLTPFATAAVAGSSAARLAMHSLLLLIAPPVGAAAAAISAVAIIAATLHAILWLARACWHSCAGGWCGSFTLLPGRLTKIMGRVFPQIPPTGHHPRRERAPRLLLRPQWRSRFASLRESCRTDLVGRPLGPVKLCLALQFLLVVCLDTGSCILNLRTTAAGQPPEAPTILQNLANSPDIATAARETVSSSSRFLITATLCLFTTAVRLFTTVAVIASSPARWHRFSYAATDAADVFAGALTPRWLLLALLAATNLPWIMSRLAARVRRTAADLTYSLLVLAVIASFHAHRAVLRAWKWGKLVSVILLVRGELAIWHRGSRSPSQLRPSVAPVPSGVRGQLPPAVSAAVAVLQRPSDVVHRMPHVSNVPSSDRPRREAAPDRGPHAACREPARDAPAPPPRRIGFALRRSARSAFALPPKTHLPRAKGAWRSAHAIQRWSQLVIDSGCTWHVHNNLKELINVRDCNDVVVDANGNEVECTKVGDLLVVVRDVRQREFKVLLRGVRYSSSFEDTLISVDQLWHTAHIDSVFRDVRALVCLRNVDDKTGEPLQLPFQRSGGLYRWNVGIVSSADASRTAPSPPDAGRTLALKSGVHAANSKSHVHALPADDAAAVLHRRLHVSLDHLRRLGERSADAPEHIAAARSLTCPVCAEANSTRLPHGHSQYHPTHAGRLVHADIVGPFVASFFGGYKYALILVDDHTRFKFVYFLKAKSEAPDKIRAFIASMNSHASSNSPTPVRVVGSLHTDNAGEFLSRKFTELLDSELVAQTTCPPHVHALNGVAERAISSVLSLTRSYLTAGNVSTSYWTHAVEMAVDVLNRTSGPAADSAGGPSSYELLTGEKPRVLGIMPFGCRAFAVKPRDQYSKTTIDPRAWVGINLGRSARSPGAYKIYVPSARRIVTTSDAYFMESFYPLRPRGEQHDDIGDQPTVPDADSAAAQPPGPPDRVTGAARQNMAAAFHDAVRDGPPPSRKALILFSGAYDRPDGISAFLQRRGIDVELIDSGINGGGGEHDILNDALFVKLHEAVRSGQYFAVFAAPPCSTYSVARFFRGSDDAGPPAVRTRDSILGISDVPKGHRRELHRANEITRRTTILLAAAHRAGAEFIIENPADRGDPSQPWLFQVADHGPIWLDPHMLALRASTSAQSATFAQCMFGAETQKYTTFWFTPGLGEQMRPLANLVCSHAPGTHASNAGGVQLPDGTWNSAATAAYPSDLNLFIAESLLALRVTQETDTGREVTDVTADEQAASPTAPPPVAPPPPPPPPLPQQPTPLPPSPATEAADAAPDSSPATPGDEATPDSPDPSPTRRRRRLQPHEYFQRGNGAIHTRSRGAVSQAKSGPDDPKNHPDAMRRDADGWGPKGAEGAEIDNHEKNESWRYELRSRLPSGRQLVKLTWVFKVKRDGRKKARLCVQGCTQRAGVDYDQTFCAAMRGGSLRLLSAIGGRLGLHMRRWDFVAAYLQGELEPGEVTYCTPPPGYTTALIDGRVRLVPLGQGDGVERMCVVTKPVYGMAQAGRRWQRSLFPWLTGWNANVDGAPQLRQSVFDSCVFFCHHTVATPSGPRAEVLLIGCYVDDLFVLSSHTDEHSLYHQFTTDLAARWDVEDEGDVQDLLSVEIEHKDDHIHLRQAKYIAKLMDTYAPNGTPASALGAEYPLSAHPASRTPADDALPQLVLTAVEQAADTIDPSLLRAYQSLVGALLYCAVNTRPDVAYAVGMLCRAMGKPTPDLYLAGLRVLYYLHHHRDIGLRYGASDLDLSGMSDSDWAVRHSTTGYVFTYALAAVSWGCKKQATVALSSCEAEIVALSESAKEAVYLSDFLSELGFPARAPTQLATDNTGARDLSYNPEHHDRVKHVERRHFFIRELVEGQRVVVPFVSTHANMADFFTKPLSGKNFFRLRNAIMNVSPDERARASLARRALRVAQVGRPTQDEPCCGRAVRCVAGSPACRRVRFDDSARDAPVRVSRRHTRSTRSAHISDSAPVHRTGGCRESCAHTHVPTVSRVVAPVPSRPHVPVSA